jgi:TPR repeat protein
MLCASPLVASGATAPAFAPDRNDPTALRCDQLADSPGDPSRVGPGVEFEKINVPQALAACQAAALRQPARARYQYLYGVVLQAAKHPGDAAAQYAAADRAGYTPGTLALGQLYANGQGVKTDTGKSLELFRRAGNAGDPYGYLGIGFMSLRSQPPNYPQAVDAFNRASRMGSHEANTYLGEMYLSGAGVPMNQRLALTLLQKSADAGDPEAQLYLGLMYYEGWGVPRDRVKAAHLVGNPAQLNYPQAAELLGHMYEEGDGGLPQDDDTALEWYVVAADGGDPVAMAKAGDMLHDQHRDDLAVMWWQKAAALGLADGEVDLAVAYLVGEGGLKKDPVAAVGWLQKAAAQNNRLAQLNLADAYRDGNGVARDPAKARALYAQAAADPQAPMAFLAKENIAKLDGKPSPLSNSVPTANRADTARPRNPAPAQQAAAAPPPSGNYWPDIPDDPFGGDGGIIRPVDPPPAARTAQPPSSNSTAQQSRTGQATVDTPAPSRGGAAPARPAESPLVRHAQSSSQELSPGAILGLGFAALVVGYMLFHNSGSGSSSDSTPYYPTPSSGTGGWDWPSTPKTYAPMQSPMPMSTPMSGNIGRILHGEDALGINGPVNRH